MLNDSAQTRLKILTFFETHGLTATQDAFQVSRRTLYRWRAVWRKTAGNSAALIPRSSAPRCRRTRQWPAAVVAELRRLRQAHPNLGKGKLAVLLKPFCLRQGLQAPSESTLGRLIHDAPDKMRHAPVKRRPARRSTPKTRKPKGFRAQYPGHCVALDSVERIRDGLRRYVLTATDLYSRVNVSVATTSHASAAAQRFLELTTTVFPFPLETVLTDNGSEFMKHFASAVADRSLRHWHTYPKTPKMNAHAERFNRTVQEEFVDYHEDLLFGDDPTLCNDKLFDYLLWYNTVRPHYSLKQLSPLQYLAQHHPECQRYWTHTDN
jgi:transposase InsO family protein